MSLTEVVNFGFITKHGELFMKLFKTLSAFCMAAVVVMAVAACAPTKNQKEPVATLMTP